MPGTDRDGRSWQAMGALGLALSLAAGCAFEMDPGDGAEIDDSQQGICAPPPYGCGFGGHDWNGVPPGSLQYNHLRKAKTDQYGITSASESRPLALCDATFASWCEIPTQWDQWRRGNYPVERGQLLAGLVECALPASYEVRIPGFDNSAVDPDHQGSVSDRVKGGLNLVPWWKTNRLSSSEQEILSGCVIALINARQAHVPLSLLGPYSSGEAGAGGDESYKYEEGVFYGQLFWPSPVVIACGGDRYSGPGNIVLGRSQRVCGYAGDECHIHLPGACNGNYVAGVSGYCVIWAGSGAQRFCVQARDDPDGHHWRYPATIHLKSVPIELPGPINRCGWNNDEPCPL